MGGVDHFDALCANYKQDRRMFGRYDRIKIHILEMIMANSYIMYKDDAERKKSKKVFTNLDFRKIVLRFLVGDYRE